MLDTEIKGQGYRVWYDPSSRTVHFEGVLRLSTSEYKPIEELLEKVRAADAAAAASAQGAQYAGEPDPYKKPREADED